MGFSQWSAGLAFAAVASSQITAPPPVFSSHSLLKMRLQASLKSRPLEITYVDEPQTLVRDGLFVEDTGAVGARIGADCEIEKTGNATPCAVARSGSSARRSAPTTRNADV